MKRTVGFVVAGLLSASIAHAADGAKGPYFGPLFGQADLTRDLDSFTSVKQDKFTWGINLGWQVHQNMAFEFQYLKPQKLSTQLDVSGFTWDITEAFNGMSFSALPSWPISDRVAIFGRVGALRVEDKVRLWIDGEYQGQGSENYTELLLGGGISAYVDRGQVRLEYMRAKFDAGKVGLLALSVNWFLSPGA